MAQRVGRGVVLLFLDRGTRRGWVVSSTPRPHFTPGKDQVPILQEAGWAPGQVWTGGNSRPHRDSIPDRPACSQSLYRLSYRAHTSVSTWTILRAERSCVAIPTEAKICSVPQTVQTCLWGPPTLLLSGHRRYLSGVKREMPHAVHFNWLWKLRMSRGIPLLRQYVFISITETVSHSLPFRLRVMKVGYALLYSVSCGRYYDITIRSFPSKQLNSHRAVGLLPHCQLT